MLNVLFFKSQHCTLVKARRAKIINSKKLLSNINASGIYQSKRKSKITQMYKTT